MSSLLSIGELKVHHMEMEKKRGTDRDRRVYPPSGGRGASYSFKAKSIHPVKQEIPLQL